MCVKPSSENLNSIPCPSHLTDSYICGVTNTPRMCDSNFNSQKEVFMRFHNVVIENFDLSVFWLSKIGKT